MIIRFIADVGMFSTVNQGKQIQVEPSKKPSVKLEPRKFDDARLSPA